MVLYRYRMRGIWWVCLAMGLSAFVLLSSFGMAEAAPGMGPELSQGQTVYVPVYSHIYSGDKERPFYLATTLSFRNTDTRREVTLVSADYFDTNGKLVTRYLEKEMTIGPQASTRFVVRESDTTGGSGAHFLVRWRSEKAVNFPIVESIMIGTQSQQGISFTSRGQVIREEK